MSIGHALLRKLIENGSSSAVRELSPALFLTDELPAYNFLLNFHSRYGGLPSLDLMLTEGFNLTEPQGPIDYYMDECRKRAIYNYINGAQGQLMEALRNRNMDGSIEIIQNALNSVSSLRTEEDVITLHEASIRVMEEYDRAHLQPGRQGITLGWDVLDDATGGAENGDLITVVARTNIGKSWTLVWMALQAWRAGHSVLFASMEMTTEAVVRRFIGLDNVVNPRFIREGRLSIYREQEIRRSIENMASRPPFHFLSGNLRKETSDLDALIQEFSPDIVYVDAGYLMKSKGGKQWRAKWEEQATVATELKDLCLARNRPLVQSVQFSKEQKAGDKAEADLMNIGGTDEIAKLSSIVLGALPGLHPRESVRRRYKVIKARESEVNTEFTTRFEFYPLNFSVVRVGSEGSQPVPQQV
jgi:replicative DNA helicase